MNQLFTEPARAALGLAFALAFILTSCGKAPPSAQAESDGENAYGPGALLAPPPQQETGGAGLAFSDSYADPAAFTPAGELEFLPAYMDVQDTGSPDGYYHFISNQQGASLLYYIDFATGQDVPLCAAPNCTHDSEACTAWFPTCVNTKRLVPVGDRIVVFYCGDVLPNVDLGQDGLPGIDVMNADGSNRQKVFRFAASDRLFWEINDGAARDGENVYFVAQHTAEQGVTRTLCAFHVPTGKTYELYTLPGGSGTIVGTDGGALILEYLPQGAAAIGEEIGDVQTSRYDLSARQEIPLFAALFDWGSGGSVCADGVRSLMGRDCVLRAYDLQTGALTSETPVAFAEGFQEPNLVGCWDGRLLVYSHQSNGDHMLPTLYYYGVDVRTGEAVRLTQERTIPEEESVLPCGIAAQWQGSYLLITATDYAELELPGVGNPYFAAVNRYALIRKEDFWQSRQNLISIQSENNGVS